MRRGSAGSGERRALSREIRRAVRGVSSWRPVRCLLYVAFELARLCCEICRSFGGVHALAGSGCRRQHRAATQLQQRRRVELRRGRRRPPGEDERVLRRLRPGDALDGPRRVVAAVRPAPLPPPCTVRSSTVREAIRKRRSWGVRVLFGEAWKVFSPRRIAMQNAVHTAPKRRPRRPKVQARN